MLISRDFTTNIRTCKGRRMITMRKDIRKIKLISLEDWTNVQDQKCWISLINKVNPCARGDTRKIMLMSYRVEYMLKMNE